MDDFSSVEPFLPSLKLYCRTLARNEWDADDLMQEVLTKVYRSLQQSPTRKVSKAYLRLIAKNAWIDHCRRQPISGESTVFDEEMLQVPSKVMNEMLIRESLEALADQLNPRQLVLILVMDIFQFSASETAQLLHTTIGAVKEGLKRARLRLQVLAAKSKESREERQHRHTNRLTNELETSKAVFEQFLTGFRSGDPEAICRTYLALIAKGIHIVRVTKADSYYFTFRDPNGHLIGFFQES